MNYDLPHRRKNLLTGEWVLVSPHRGRRPWLGQVEKILPENLPAFDPECTLCPGNTRSSGLVNASYTSTFVFDNDFAALLPPQAGQKINETTRGLFQAKADAGVCRVICFSPRHDLTLPELPLEHIEAVVRTWSEQTQDLASRSFIDYVQVFENKGAAMGCSNPHPHSQVWCSAHIPTEPAKELACQRNYSRQHTGCLLCDVLSTERQAGERLVAANETFTALTPFWAVWPFEVMLVANRHCGALPELTSAEVSGLADILKRVTTRYDNLFEVSFPYSMGFHQAPVDGKDHSSWHLHAHFYPPLLRSATVRKFMVGFEMLGMPQRDLTPESAAARLREVSEIHYKAGIRD
jgi:UDPglucose--hexose-1-phosphate uridylyltransferase